MKTAALKLNPSHRLHKKSRGVSKSYAKSASNADASSAAPSWHHLDAAEKTAALFEPDILAAAQFFGNFRRKTLIEPERRLTVAILEDAINCFQDNVSAESGKAKKLFEDAHEWFVAEDSNWIFSFRNVCELLAIDPDYLRAGLRRWQEQQLAHHNGSGVG
jgi:hypothetical protein